MQGAIGDRGRSPLPKAALAQCIAGGLVAAAWVGLPHLTIDTQTVPAWAWAVAWGVLATGFTALFRLPRWWLPLQFALPVLLWAGQGADIPFWAFPLVLVLLGGIFWNAVLEGVPLYLTNKTTWKALADNLPDEEQPLGHQVAFADLGCGLGGCLAYLGRARPDARFVGVETAPLTFALCKLRFLFGGPKNVEIHYLSLWDLDLQPFDVVYCFLSPRPMARLFEKAQAEMRPGTQLISNTFEVEGHPPEDEMILADRRQTRLMRWTPASPAKPL